MFPLVNPGLIRIRLSNRLSLLPPRCKEYQPAPAKKRIFNCLAWSDWGFLYGRMKDNDERSIHWIINWPVCKVAPRANYIGGTISNCSLFCHIDGEVIRSFNCGYCLFTSFTPRPPPLSAHLTCRPCRDWSNYQKCRTGGCAGTCSTYYH